MPRETIAQMWRIFARKAMPGGTRPAQEKQLRRAFTIGFLEGICEGTEAMQNGDTPRLCALMLEIEEFKRDVEEGKF